MTTLLLNSFTAVWKIPVQYHLGLQKVFPNLHVGGGCLDKWGDSTSKVYQDRIKSTMIAKSARIEKILYIIKYTINKASKDRCSVFI